MWASSLYVVILLLPRHCRIQDLCPEESTLGPLNHLLVNTAWWVVHDNCALLGVDLGVQTSVPNKVDDPFLAFLVVQTQAGAQSLDINACVDLAVALKDQVSGVVDESVGASSKEEVGSQHLLGTGQLSLGLLEVEVDEQGAHELGQGVVVLVGLLAHDADNVLELFLLHTRVASAAAAGDNGSGEVSQDPGAGGLNGVDVGGAEEKVEKGVAGGVAVEEGEEGPVDKPCAMLQLRKRVVEQFGVDTLLHFLNLLEGGLPARCEDFRGQLTPCGCRDFVVVCGKDTELVKQIGGGAVVAAAVLEVAEIVKRVDHFDGDL